MKLHETIKNFYTKCLKPYLKVEVLANGKWNSIDSLNITDKQYFYEITTDTHKLKCTEKHIVIDEHGEEIFAKDSLGKNVYTDKGIEKVISVVKTTEYDNAYDLSLHKDTDNLYFTNGILSHNCIIIDEMAFIPKNIIDDFFASVMPVISSSKNSKAIVVSTPNGASGLYYDIWQQANSKDTGKNKEGWTPFQIHWWETGGIRDEEWKQQQIATIGIERWKQEFECDFLTSSTKKLIPDDITEKYKMKLTEFKLQGLLEGKKQKILSQREDKLYEFTMWHEFDPQRTYAASGDIAEGVGGDSSVLYVWDITDLQNVVMCAKFSSNQVSVVEFAYVITKILALYNNPYFIAERNGCSSGTLDTLRITYQYPRLVTEGKNNEVGVFSHVTVKGKSCLWTREMLTTQGFGFTIYDKDLIDDWQVFVKKDTNGVNLVYKALPPAHDDFIMSFVWLCYLLKNEVVERYYHVCDVFNSATGVTYARRLEPLKSYTVEELNKVTKDPLYKEFLDFKNEIQNKLGKALSLERQEEQQASMFQFPQRPDIYFGGYDTEDSWNAPSRFSNQNAISLNPYNRFPSFVINHGGGFM